MEVYHSTNNTKKTTPMSKIILRYDCKKNGNDSHKSNLGKPISKLMTCGNDSGSRIVNTTLRNNNEDILTKNSLNKKKEFRIINLCNTKPESQIPETSNLKKYPIFIYRNIHELTISNLTEDNKKYIDNRRKSLDANISNFKTLSSNSKIHIKDIPPSPESVKKIELCSYLKLRNSNSSNTMNDIINRSRRSCRVKNFKVMTEKKELEKKLNAKKEIKPSHINNVCHNNIPNTEILDSTTTVSDDSDSYNFNNKLLKRKRYSFTIEENNVSPSENSDNHSLKFNSSDFSNTHSPKLDAEKTLVETNFPEGPELSTGSFKELQNIFNEKLTSLSFIESCSKMFHPRTVPSSILQKEINFEDSIKDIIVHNDIKGKQREKLSKFKSSIKCRSKIQKSKLRWKTYLRSRNTIKTRLQVLHSKAILKEKRSSNLVKNSINPLLNKKTKIKEERPERTKKRKSKILLKKRNDRMASKCEMILDTNSRMSLRTKIKCDTNLQTTSFEVKKGVNDTISQDAMKEHDYVAQTKNKNKIIGKSLNGHVKNTKQDIQKIEILNNLKKKCPIKLKFNNITPKFKKDMLKDSEVLKDVHTEVINEVPNDSDVTEVINDKISLLNRMPEDISISSECLQVHKDINFKGFLKSDSHCHIANVSKKGLNLKKTLSSFINKDKDTNNIKTLNCDLRKRKYISKKQSPDKNINIPIINPLSFVSIDSPNNTLTYSINSEKTVSNDNQYTEEQDVSSTTDFQKDSHKIIVRKLAVKTLHRNLIQSSNLTGKALIVNKDNDIQTLPNSFNKLNKRQHTIHISKDNGRLLSCQYYNYNLVIIQANIISFWTQSPLGSLLEAQNMWIPRGSVQRLKPDNGSLLAVCKENITFTENSIASVELWTKEHTSDKRESPLADVFAVIYFWRLGQSGLDKKFLQLETINGFAEDVRCVIMRNSPNIFVTWRTIKDDIPLSLIHCYQLANDYGTIASIKEMSPVHHRIRSLHNVEDTDSIVLGCGDHNITLWNLEYGYIVATINIEDKLPEPSCLWAKCDRGFLFTIQSHSDAVIKLIAINGNNSGWKRLQVYKTPNGYKNLQGVSVDNGVLVSFFDNGILCWNLESAELIAEELSTKETYFPSGKFIITYDSNQELKVKNSVSYIMKNYDCLDS